MTEKQKVTPMNLRKIAEESERKLPEIYAIEIREAIIKFLESEGERASKFHEVSKGSYNPFKNIATFASLNKLVKKEFLEDYGIINKSEKIVDGIIDWLLTKHNIVGKKIETDQEKDIVFFYDFSEETGGQVQPVYKNITEEKIDWLIEKMEEKLVEVANNAETQHIFVFNRQEGFPYITLAEQRNLIQYFKNKGFAGLDDCGFNFEDLDNNQIKISF